MIRCLSVLKHKSTLNTLYSKQYTYSAPVLNKWYDNESKVFSNGNYITIASSYLSACVNS